MSGEVTISIQAGWLLNLLVLGLNDIGFVRRFRRISLEFPARGRFGCVSSFLLYCKEEESNRETGC